MNTIPIEERELWRRKRTGLSFTLYRNIEAQPRKLWLVHDYLGDAELSCIFGPPGSGKSVLAGDLAAHVAAGRPWFGRRVQQGAVLYVAIERAALVKRRLAAFRDHHRNAFLRDGPPTLRERRRDLRTLKDALLARKNDFATALNTDFGHRSRHESLLFDVGSVVNAIKYMRSNLARWMRPDRRHVAAVFLPGSARAVYQPLGVVGILSPWNFPFSLALTPLATAIAAGNRVMLKPSELTPAITELLASMLAELFPEDQVAVVKGDANVASAFSTLAFDRILFTGSTPVGRAVMRAASEHLVPVTLELGGKSPAIVARDASLGTAVRRIAYGKLANGGQSCVSPDYAPVSQEAVEAFVSAYRSAVETLYPDGADNPDYTWIINDRHFAQLYEARRRRACQGCACD